MGELPLNDAGSAFVKKGAEAAGNRAINAIVDYCKKGMGIAKVSVGASFVRYLENAAKRYNQIKTIATGTQPRPILGEGALYVHTNVSYQGVPHPTREVAPLLQIDNNLLIVGTGGAGKSMLMRYLFLDTAHKKDGSYIPILLELRRISGAAGGGVTIQSVLELVYACMKDFDVRLDREQFEYSLRSGKYLFLLDGFDEIPDALAREAADAIQGFCAKYSDNACIVTSRPYAQISPLQTFSTLEVLPLAKGQAVELARRIGGGSERAEEFCDQLDKNLFEQHQSFAENPLLLSMMYLTFMRNYSIPEHLSDFYQKAYEALYSEHDAMDKGAFHRDFQCKTLDEKSFQKLFSYFCFQSYFSSIYEFSKQYLIAQLQKGIEKLRLGSVNAHDYLADLQKIVCMIVRDGGQYRFAHRSFQAYFAACYTCDLTDEEQKRFFSGLLVKETYYNKRDYYTLLNQLASERFAANALEDGLRRLQEEADAAPDPDSFLLKKVYWGVSEFDDGDAKTIGWSITSSRTFNLFVLFSRFIARKSYGIFSDDFQSRISDYLGEGFDLSFSQIDEDERLTEDARKQLYRLLIQYAGIEDFRADVRRWLAEQDAKRKALETTSFTSLLENL